METFSFSPPINLVEEGKWLLGAISFECTNSVFNVTDKNNSFSITIPGHWETKSAEKTIDELNNLLDLRSQNGIELHVEQVGKKRLILTNDYSLSSLRTFKEEILEELKKATYEDVEDLVYRFQLTYDEIIDILDLKYILTKRRGYSLKPNIYQISDINETLKYILPDNVKKSVTIDDNKLKSNLKINQTLIFNKRSFLSTILGTTQSYSGPLGDLDGYIQLIPGTFKSDKPINNNSFDNIHLKCDCMEGSIVNGVRDPTLYSFALDKPPFHKTPKEPKIKLFKKVNKSVFSHIRFYLEDDDHKEIDFNEKTISFTCQLSKIFYWFFYTYNYTKYK